MTAASISPTGSADPVPARGFSARWSLHSFRTQVALAFALLAILLAVTLSLGIGYMFAKIARADELVALRSVASNAGRLLADGLASRSRQLEVISRSRTLWQDGLDSEHVRQLLERVRLVTPYSAWLGVASPDGTVRSAIDGLLVGENVGERPWFRSGLQGTHLNDLHKAKLLAALLPPTRDGSAPRFVDFSSPIILGGRTIGVIGMHGSWDWAQSVIESLLPENAAARRLEVFVLDHEGKTIYASSGGDLEAWDRRGLERDPDTGEQYLRAAVEVRADALPNDLGWQVVAREPESIGYAEARRVQLRSLLFGVVMAAGASALGWWLATRMTQPLHDIAGAAMAVEAGTEGASIPVLGMNPELSQLSTALSRMTNKLQGANQELEARVRERTAALERANRELDRQSRTDPLTGLFNRRGLDDQFTRTIASARRRRAGFSVLMIDIDHFKRINDTHGHDIGDLALKSLAAALQHRLRETDVIARFGGEEFAVLLPDTEGGQALLVAEALVAMVREQPIEPVGRITISCGIAQVRLQGDTAQKALARADEALYRAKGEGRDRAVAERSFEVATA